MPAPGASFATVAHSCARLGRQVDQAARRVGTVSGGLVFLSGELAERGVAAAETLAALRLGAPLLVLAGAGVLSEQAEIEGQSACAGILWSGGHSRALGVCAATATELGNRLASGIKALERPQQSSVLTFLKPNSVDPHVLEPLQDLARPERVLGAGSHLNCPLVVVSQSGDLQVCDAAALLVSGLSAPTIASSAACRLLTPLLPITRVRGSMILELSGEPALDVLSSLGSSHDGKSLILAALAPNFDSELSRQPLLIRAIQGVDPTRGGVMISDEVKEGQRLAFAVRDAAAARADLESMARQLALDTRGAAPRFGIYLNCAGRGSRLYGGSEVDTKLLKARLPDLPFAGMQSSFEIAPYEGKPVLQLYTGVFALFTSPS